MPGYVREVKSRSKDPKQNGKRAGWKARWRPAGDGSDRGRRERSFRTEREAKAWLTRMDAAAERGALPRKEHMTLAEVAEEWKGTWADLAPRTCAGYASILAVHVLPAFGSRPVGKITPRDIQVWANRLAASRSPNTVRRVMDVLRSVLRVAVERRYLATNPAEPVRLPRPRRAIDIAPLTHPEADALLAALPERWRLPVLLDAYTGLRAGELWALRRSDVDLARGELLVDEALKEVTTDAAERVPAEQRVTPSLILGPTKTHAVRMVSIPAFLRPQLTVHLATRPPDPDAWLFVTPTGEAVRHNLFQKRVFNKAVRRALNRPFRFHDLRHTTAAWLIEAGVHPLEIKTRLGHASITTTMDVYGHVYPSAEARLAGILDEARSRALADADAEAEEVPAELPAAA